MKAREKRTLMKAAGALIAVLTLFSSVSGCRKAGEDVIVDIGTPKPTQGALVTEPPHADPSTPEPTADITAGPTAWIVPPITSISGTYVAYEGTNVIRVDDRAYEVCYFVPDVAKIYADIVTRAANELAGTTNVYSLIIPAAYGVMMPDDMKSKVPSKIDLGECIENAYSMMAGNVRTVSCYDSLLHHRNEFIFFRTDHHWTQLGAYYAYEAFMLKKGVSPYPVDAHRSVEYGDFLGTLYKDSKNDPALLPAETIKAWYPVSEGVRMEVHYNNGAVVQVPIIEDANKFGTSAKYSIFAGGDNPLTVFTNPAVTDGSVLIVIKESFGDAMMPFLCDHYSTVYEIDYRLWEGDVIQLAKEVHATDLLFANSIAVVSAKTSLGKINGIIK